MKISSVSKKVLASALSAAMVVAFAPTVAFGAETSGVKSDKAIAVTIDANGGTGTIPSYPTATQGGEITLPELTKYDHVISGWYYDSDKDGKIDVAKDDNLGYNSANRTYYLPYGIDAVTLVPVYKMPEVTAKSVAFKKNTADKDALFFKFDTATLAEPDAGKYVMKVYDPYNTEITSFDLKALWSLGSNDGLSINFETAKSDASDKYNLGADVKAKEGTYTFSMVYTDSKGAEHVISTETAEVAKVTLKDATGAKISDNLVQAKGNFELPQAGSSDVTWLDASGNVAGTTGSTIKVTGSCTLTAKAGTDVVSSAAYESGSFKVRFGSAITTNVANPRVDGNVSYDLAVAGPAGNTIYSVEGISVTSGHTYDISFGNVAGNRFDNGVTETAGYYTFTLTKTETNAAGTPDTVATSTVKVPLTEFKYDANGGKLADTVKGEFVSGADPAAGTTLTVDINVTAPKGKVYDYYTLNGEKLLATSKVKVGEVNTYSVAWKDAAVVNVADPVLVSAVKNSDAAQYKYTIKVETATPGAQIKWGTSTGNTTTAYDPATGINTNSTTVYVKAYRVASATAGTLEGDSAEVAFTAVNAKAADWTAAAKAGKIMTYTGLTKTKWAEQPSVKAAIEAGQAALDAAVFATAEDWEALTQTQIKAVYDAVLAEAKAQLAAYADDALVVVGDKAYTIDAKTLKAANDKIAAQEAYVAKQSADSYLGAVYSSAVGVYIDAANTALQAATASKLTAADIKAAADVTAALQAAKTGEEAEAALAAYEALTADQKKLVATADVATAQKVADEAKAAAELKVAQDDAAVSKARSTSKTVKAGKNGKTTKKQSVTLKKITSASGAKVTYKKVSGKKAITVKSGKAYLAKGVKKGTYKATVKATCGTQTAKITVKFVVK